MVIKSLKNRKQVPFKVGDSRKVTIRTDKPFIEMCSGQKIMLESVRTHMIITDVEVKMLYA